MRICTQLHVQTSAQLKVTTCTLLHYSDLPSVVCALGIMIVATGLISPFQPYATSQLRLEVRMYMCIVRACAYKNNRQCSDGVQFEILYYHSCVTAAFDLQCLQLCRRFPRYLTLFLWWNLGTELTTGNGLVRT